MLDRLKHVGWIDRALRRPPGFCGQARREIAEAEAPNLAARRHWRDARVARTLALAARLPGYRGIPAGSPLAEWPILTKSTLLGREAAFASGGLLPTIRAATGGTTGAPLKLTRNPRGIAFEQATLDALCAGFGVDLETARVAVLRGDSIKPADDLAPPFHIDEGPARRVFSAHHLSPATIAAFLAELRSFAPHVLFAYPSSLAHLVDLAAGRQAPRIPLVFASSEVMPEALPARVAAAFGSRVVDFYGQAERVAAAVSIDGGLFRFLPAYGAVELAPEGEGMARILSTSLRDGGQILVRYDTGDRIRVADHDPARLERIALGLEPFEAVDGRTSECVDLPDGRRIIGLNHLPRGVEGATSIQVRVADAGEVDLLVVRRDDWSDASQRRLLANFAAKFPTSVRPRIVFADAPVRTPAGKAPLLLPQVRRACEALPAPRARTGGRPAVLIK